MSNTLLQRILIKCDNKDVVLSKTILRKTNAYLLGINRRNSVTAERYRYFGITMKDLQSFFAQKAKSSFQKVLDSMKLVFLSVNGPSFPIVILSNL